MANKTRACGSSSEFKRGTVKVALQISRVGVLHGNSVLCKIEIKGITYGGKLVQNLRTK